MEGQWVVNFDPKWGGPVSVTFPGLTNWSKHQDEGIRYYSGTAVYNKTFRIDFDLKKDEQYFLRLENVKRCRYCRSKNQRKR
ncbi:MAG: glycosylhydrolase-like jelly roll fold domain-containing protein [Mangrovibacterium sp.]